MSPTVIDPSDTIVALATPRGGALRGILRLSGPHAWDLFGDLFRPGLPEPREDFRPRAVEGHLTLPPLTLPVPATLYLSRAPRSTTGQDLVELHTLGSPPILELSLSTFIARGARQALPGEFTMRAFLNGKLDLTAAEAVLGLIDAKSSRQAEVAIQQMAGGISRPIVRLREQLLDLLAELEAGLDFAEEDLEFIDRSELRTALESASVQLKDLARQMQGRAVSDDRRRAVLLGPPNVGKSSLFNALLGRDAALVNQTAGTTRDYLVGELRLSDCLLELVDTAGIDHAADAPNRQAQTVRDSVASDADLLLWCVDSSDPESAATFPADIMKQSKCVLVVHTKSDLSRHAKANKGVPAAACLASEELTDSHGSATDAKSSVLSTQHSDPETTTYSPTSHLSPIPVSSITGAGIPELQRAIENWGRGSREDSTGVVAATAARCRQAISGAQETIDRARDTIDSQAGDDLIAMELRLALDDLGQVVGAVVTEDILDRIFSRFCIGK